MQGKKVLLSLLVLITVSGFAFALSSEEALAKATPYLDSSMSPLPKELAVLNDNYFVYAPSIYSAQRIFVAVADSTGEIETDSTRLNAIGGGVYDYGVLSEYIQKNKISFSDMQTPLQQTVAAINRDVDALNALASRTQQSYPNENFDDLIAKASVLQGDASELQSLAGDGESLETQFDNDFTTTSLDALLRYYETVFTKSSDFITAYDGYNNAISAKQTEIFKSNIPAPDNENIVKNLDNMRLKVDLFENMRFLKPWDNVQKLDASKDKWVNDSVASFQYKKLTLDTLAQYNQVKPLVQSVLYNRPALEQCGLKDDVSTLQSNWAQVDALVARGSTSDFQRLPAKLDAIKTEYNSLKAKFDACANPNSQSSSPVQPSSPQSSYLPILVVLVIAAGAYLFWRYRKSQEETYS